jgi:DNA-binding XRE family transcriptional regulator
MTEYLDFNFSSAEEISQTLAQRLKRLRIHKAISQADMAERMGVSRSTLNTLENTGKGSVIAWFKLVQCLGQEGQLQPLFKPVITSIADMAEQQKPARQRVARQRKHRLPMDRP